jgi:hypothetical protein
VPEQQDLQQHDSSEDLSSMAKDLAACDAPDELSKAMPLYCKLPGARSAALPSIFSGRSGPARRMKKSRLASYSKRQSELRRA